tara:strand:- start:118 stop:663 length:546 start_codon:yes stop_codon:yes gene_type:complete
MINFIKIDGINEITRELVLYSDSITYNIDQTSSHSLKNNDIPNELPMLHNWLSKTFKLYPIIYKFYFLPPKTSMKPHIDHRGSYRIPWGLNIPVANANCAKLCFYECPEENIKTKIVGRHIAYAAPMDPTKMTLLNSYVVDAPCILRTDVMHDAINNSETLTRIMFLLRWNDSKKYEDLLI